MSDDLAKVLKELHGIVNKFRIRGPGVSGNLKNGHIVKPGSAQIKSGSTTP